MVLLALPRPRATGLASVMAELVEGYGDYPVFAVPVGHMGVVQAQLAAQVGAPPTMTLSAFAAAVCPEFRPEFCCRYSSWAAVPAGWQATAAKRCIGRQAFLLHDCCIWFPSCRPPCLTTPGHRA